MSAEGQKDSVSLWPVSSSTEEHTSLSSLGARRSLLKPLPSWRWVFCLDLLLCRADLPVSSSALLSCPTGRHIANHHHRSSHPTLATSPHPLKQQRLWTPLALPSAVRRPISSSLAREAAYLASSPTCRRINIGSVWSGTSRLLCARFMKV